MHTTTATLLYVYQVLLRRESAKKEHKADAVDLLHKYSVAALLVVVIRVAFCCLKAREKNFILRTLKYDKNTH
jgi:hypothetical protein